MTFTSTYGRSRGRGRMIAAYALAVAVVHAAVSTAAAFVIAPYSMDPIATADALATLSLASAGMSCVGFVATATYLSKRIRPTTGIIAGWLCGMLCIAVCSLAVAGVEYSLILYLALLAPTLLAILLATLFDRQKSGWQTY